MKEPKLTLTANLVKLIAEIDEFKGRWEALKTLSLFSQDDCTQPAGQADLGFRRPIAART